MPTKKEITDAIAVLKRAVNEGSGYTNAEADRLLIELADLEDELTEGVS